MLHTSLVALAFTIFGLCVGSFLNLCIDRLPLDQSIVAPPSHCPSCGRRVSAFDLVPFFNYLWLKGRCRYCRVPIPIRLPLVELLTGTLFALLYWHFGWSGELGMALFYAALLIVIFFIDLEHQLILDKVSYPGIVAAFAFSFLWPHSGWPDSGVLNAMIGGAIGFAIFVPPIIGYRAYHAYHGRAGPSHQGHEDDTVSQAEADADVLREGIGRGDLKLGLMIGLMVGNPEVLVACLLGMIGGGVVAVLLLALGIRGRRDPIPFGPFLCVSGMVALLWGRDIIDWYTGGFD